MVGVFDLRAPPRGDESVILDDGTVLPLRAEGSLNLRFDMEPTHGVDATSFCVHLTKVYVLAGTVRPRFFAVGTTTTGYHSEQDGCAFICGETKVRP